MLADPFIKCRWFGLPKVSHTSYQSGEEASEGHCEYFLFHRRLMLGGNTLTCMCVSALWCSRMQTLAYLKEGLCRVADDPRDVASARKPFMLPSQQQQPKRRGGASTASAESFMQPQLLFPCSSATSASALLSGSSVNEGGLMELPDGTRLEAEQVAMKVCRGSQLCHCHYPRANRSFGNHLSSRQSSIGSLLCSHWCQGNT